MNKLPVELIINILDYEGRSVRWRNGKFINKYTGDISHMYTINFKHYYFNLGNNSCIIDIIYEKSVSSLLDYSYNKILVAYKIINNELSYIIGNLNKSTEYIYNPTTNKWTQELLLLNTSAT